LKQKKTNNYFISNKNRNKTNGKGKMKNNKGSTLIEALIAAAIIGFVVVSILAAISQQQTTTQNTMDKNTAVMLTQLRLEEMMKFSAQQLAEETFIDWIIVKNYGFEVYTAAQGNPNQERQFQRTTEITLDLLQKLATIRVTVEYGSYFKLASNVLVYPTRVVLTTRRSVL